MDLPPVASVCSPSLHRLTKKVTTLYVKRLRVQEAEETLFVCVHSTFPKFRERTQGTYFIKKRYIKYSSVSFDISVYIRLSFLSLFWNFELLLGLCLPILFFLGFSMPQLSRSDAPIEQIQKLIYRIQSSQGLNLERTTLQLAAFISIDSVNLNSLQDSYSIHHSRSRLNRLSV